MDAFEGLQQGRLRGRRALKDEISVLGGTYVTVKVDGVSANDDKWHAGASQKLKDGQGIVNIWHECCVGAGFSPQYRR